MTFSRKLSFLGLPALGLLSLVAPMSATSITGGASISGSVTVTPTQIIFQPAFLAQSATSQTGSFSGLTGGTFVVSTLSGPPLTGSVSVPDFISFSKGLGTPITFDLQQILPGFGTAAGCSSNSVGSECTPAGSPFTLTQASANQVTVTLSLNGIAYTGTSASGSTPTTGIFTTQLSQPPNACNTITSCFAILLAGGSVTADYSANFSANTVPEPSSLFLMGIGLIGAGSFARLRFRKP